MMAHASLHVDDETVKAKTGKTWREWFDILSRGSSRNMSHEDMTTFLGRQFRLNDWWCQMITNALEQHSGRREEHQRPEDYEISVSRTFPVDVKTLMNGGFQSENEAAGFKNRVSKSLL